jgi:hypothetical protein
VQKGLTPQFIFLPFQFDHKVWKRGRLLECVWENWPKCSKNRPIFCQTSKFYLIENLERYNENC